MAIKQELLATKLPMVLTRQLDEICAKFGFRKNFIIESAIRDKIEDILDAHDLKIAISESTGFHDWESVKKKIKI